MIKSRISHFLTEISNISLFTVLTIRYLFRKPFETREFGKQLFEAGYKSFGLIGITAFIMGLVLTMQTLPVMAEFGTESWVPTMIFISVVIEIGPVITALLFAGKVGLRTDLFEDQLYINMENIKSVQRRPKEAERRENFYKALDELYAKAVFSNVPEEYYGADIWKYFYEDLNSDLSNDTLTRNFLFILTDGYPIVGKDLSKLQAVKDDYPELHIVLMEASPREKDMEWDHIMEMWKTWFDSMKISDYTFIKRKAITKEIEQVKEIIDKK